MTCKLLSSTKINAEVLPAREDGVRGNTLPVFHSSEVFEAGL